MFFDMQKYNKWFSELEQPQPNRQYNPLPEPEYQSEQVDESDLHENFKEIESAHLANKKFALYESELKQYNSWVEQGKIAREKAETIDKLVKAIEKEKQDMIKTAKMPDGFSFSDNGLLYNGYELNKNAQSSSALYIAGLKLATMNLAELKTIHFDASTLDKKSLIEVENYANSIGLQLLIERPDFDGGDIKYEIINLD
jgi:hypothetical protein